MKKDKQTFFKMLGFEYARVNDISYAKFLNFTFYKRVGNAFSLFGIKYIPKDKRWLN